MKISNIDEYENGWFMGNFSPALFPHQKEFEVAIHKHKAGEISDGHYHAVATEINVIISGSVNIGFNGTKTQLYEDGIWVTYPYENPTVIFLEDTKLLIIKTPSVPGDKYYEVEKYSHPNVTPLLPEQLEEIRNWMPSQEQADELFLGMEKYQPTKDAIMAGLGIPAELWEKEYEAKYSDAGSSNKVDR